jgi:hypothetical protein
MAKAKYFSHDEQPKAFVAIYCPGCECKHHLQIEYIQEFEVKTNEEGTKVVTAIASNRPIWGFNGDLDKPTFTPSLLVKSGIYVEGDKYKERMEESEWDWYVSESKICHTFIRDGKIEFLGDCTHSLAGKTVDLPEYPQSDSFK